MPKPHIGPGWEGYITQENMSALLEAFETMLADKKFTQVTINHNTGPVPAVATSLELIKGEITVGSLTDYQCFIKIHYKRPGLRGEDAWYVRTHDRAEFPKTHAYFEFSGGGDRVTIHNPRPNGSIEIQAIVLQD